MTRDAQYDFQLNIGDGLPSDKAFIYQSLLDLLGAHVVTPEEVRDYVRNQLGLPLKDTPNPQEQPQPQMMPEAQQPMPEQPQQQLPPEIMAMLQQAQAQQQQPEAMQPEGQVLPMQGGVMAG
ncbi:hypothetical protein D3C72_1970630 [compost metagenome]